MDLDIYQILGKKGYSTDIKYLILKKLREMGGIDKDIYSFCKNCCGRKMPTERICTWFYLWNNYEIRESKDIKKILDKYVYKSNIIKDGKRDIETPFNNLLAILDSNPYLILELGIEICDNIVGLLDLKLSKERDESLIARYARKNIKELGWSCTPIDHIRNHLNMKKFDERLRECLKNYNMSIEYDCLYFNKHLVMEKFICNYIKKNLISNNIIGEGTSTLDKSQLHAFHSCKDDRISILTGGAGTGKTKVIENLCECLDDSLHYCVLAYTGKACSNIMNRLEGVKTYTIHKRINAYDYINNPHQKDSSDYTDPQQEDYKDDLIIFDESSMINISILFKLLKYHGSSSQLLFVGDPNQLPPIGFGDIFNDLILSKSFSHYHLEKIHRSNKGICDVSISVSKGKSIYENDSVKFIQPNDIESILLRHNKSINLDPLITIISPFQKDCIKYNKLCQDLLNPKSNKKNELKFGDTIYRVGDRIMNTRNLYK